MTNSTATQPVINTAYLVEQEQDRQSYPALQASDYQPRNLNEKISIGMTEEIFQALHESSQQALQCETKGVTFGEEQVLFFCLPQTQIVILGMPKLHVVDKDSGQVSHLQKGMKLAGTGRVTTAKLFVLLMQSQDSFVMDVNGSPQVFTLNLKSSKTALLGNNKSVVGDGTIASLNAGLRKHYKVSKGWLSHLVAVELVAVPTKFTSSQDKKVSSLGIMFQLQGTAKVLPESLQAQAFEILHDETLAKAMADPYGIKGQVEILPVVSDDFADC
ncbi:MAG: hypothetical protein ACRC62_15820 [Microcoleus sp.]